MTDTAFAQITDAERDAAPVTQETSAPTKTPIVPAPEGLENFRYGYKGFGDLKTIYPYYNDKRELLGYVGRFEEKQPDGSIKKNTPPLCFCEKDGKTFWSAVKFPVDKTPLYNLPAALDEPDAPLLFVEGEKTTEAAKQMDLGFVVVATIGGSSGATRSDYSPCRGRKVCIWPDNDEAGMKYADDVTRLALDAGAAEVKLVELDDKLPGDGWDLADPVPENVDIGKYLHEARIVDEPTPKLPVGYHLRKDGIYSEDDEDILHWLCSPLWPVAQTRDGRGENWGVIIRFRDNDGREKEFVIAKEHFAAEGTVLLSQLLSMGLGVKPGKGGKTAFMNFLMMLRPDRRAFAATRVGWCEVDGHGDPFVFPDEVIGDTGNEIVRFQSVNAVRQTFSQRGSHQDWMNHVARYAPGNSRLTLMLSLAFVPPLVRPTQAESGVINLVGPSSCGKTTGLKVAVSACNGPEHIQTWRATSNGLEAVCEAHNDCLLALDEMGQSNALEIGQTAYMITNGAGKSRANRNGDARPPKTWQTIVASTGEVGIADKMGEDCRAGRTMAGHLVRVIDIAADAGAGMGLFEEIYGYESPDTFARMLADNSRLYYGTAIRLFIRKLVADKQEAVEQVLASQRAFVAEHCPTGADGQVLRVAQRFGLIAAAGELATGFGVLPWVEGIATQSAARCFKDWLEARGTAGPSEIENAIAQVREILIKHGQSRFQADAGDEDILVRDRLGFTERDDDSVFDYFFPPDTWKRVACKGFNANHVAAEMAKRGLLVSDSSGKTSVVKKFPGLKKGRFYQVSGAILGGDGGA